MKENAYPPTKDGMPDLSLYADPLEYYIEMYETFARSINRKMDLAEANRQFDRRCHAQYGLIAKGAAAIPYALRMLSSTKADIREDGAAILAWLGRLPEVVDGLLTALETETDEVAKSVLISSLGRLRAKKAIPALACILRDEDEHGDTRWHTAEALGLIARRSFVRKPNPVQAALEWLEQRGSDWGAPA